MSFFSDFFSVGGTGNRLITQAGTIGIGLVANEGAQIKSDYEVGLKKVANDSSLGEDNIKLQTAQLDLERQAASAKYDDQKRNDALLAVAIVVGLIAIVLISIKFIGNRSEKSR